MSALSFAIRTAVAKTLRGRTLAGDRVVDSPIEPLAYLTGEGAEPKPLIAIFISDIKKPVINGRDIAGAQAEAQVTIQIYCPQEVALNVQGTPITVSGTGIAAVLDLVERQVEAALSSDDTEWGKIFRRLITQYSNVHSGRVLVRVGEAVEGVSIPMAEITYTCRTIIEPGYGKPLDGLWAQIDAAFRLDPEYAPLADILKGLIENPMGLPAWRVLQALQGATHAEAVNVGIAPQGLEPDEAPEILQGIYLTNPPP